MRAFGYLAGLSLMLWAILLGGDGFVFVNVPSLMLVPGAAVAFTLAAHGNTLWRALHAGFLSPADQPEEGGRLVRVLRTSRATLHGIGITSTLTGWIQMAAG